MQLSKKYNPKEVEEKIYRLWQKFGFFNPDKLPGKRNKSYTIVLPPPNVTGRLHMGHALNATVQDVLIRWKRLLGYKTLWLPGTDHAGIATQVKVEKQIKKEGKTRFDLGKKLFIKRVWQWKEKYGNIILDQFKKLGSSLDWSRTRFTMDKGYSEAVKKTFLRYYKKGWIYQKERPINWCPSCQTSLSDLELEHKEEKGNIWYIKYPLAKNSKFQTSNNKQTQNYKLKSNFIIVATTRPETMLGDTAVAVNPKDKRYKKLIGKYAILPLAGKEIPIISDKLVDIEFGTGAVKVTPAHDPNDYIMGISHKLDVVKVIGEDGRMTKKAPPAYRGLKVSKNWD
jgi:valyl-tRNA synthetase